MDVTTIGFPGRVQSRVIRWNISEIQGVSMSNFQNGSLPISRPVKIALSNFRFCRPQFPAFETWLFISLLPASAVSDIAG